MRSHAGARPFAPPLQRRPVPRLPPYAPVERSSPAVSPVPEPPHWPVGHVPLARLSANTSLETAKRSARRGLHVARDVYTNGGTGGPQRGESCQASGAPSSKSQGQRGGPLGVSAGQSTRAKRSVLRRSHKLARLPW